MKSNQSSTWLKRIKNCSLWQQTYTFLPIYSSHSTLLIIFISHLLYPRSKFNQNSEASYVCPGDRPSKRTMPVPDLWSPTYPRVHKLILQPPTYPPNVKNNYVPQLWYNLVHPTTYNTKLLTTNIFSRNCLPKGQFVYELFIITPEKLLEIYVYLLNTTALELSYLIMYCILIRLCCYNLR